MLGNNFYIPERVSLVSDHIGFLVKSAKSEQERAIVGAHGSGGDLSTRRVEIHSGMGERFPPIPL